MLAVVKTSETRVDVEAAESLSIAVVELLYVSMLVSVVDDVDLVTRVRLLPP